MFVATSIRTSRSLGDSAIRISAKSFRIDETGIVSITNNNVANPYNYTARRVVQTQNSIIGPQIGTDVFWELTDDIRIGGVNRFLIGPNFAQSTVHQSANAYSSALNQSVVYSRAQYDGRTQVTGVMDLQLTMDIRLTKNIVLKGGYQFLWLYQVALALFRVSTTSRHPTDHRSWCNLTAVRFSTVPLQGWKSRGVDSINRMKVCQTSSTSLLMGDRA